MQESANPARTIRGRVDMDKEVLSEEKSTTGRNPAHGRFSILRIRFKGRSKSENPTL